MLQSTPLFYVRFLSSSSTRTPPQSDSLTDDLVTSLSLFVLLIPLELDSGIESGTQSLRRTSSTKIWFLTSTSSRLHCKVRYSCWLRFRVFAPPVLCTNTLLYFSRVTDSVTTHSLEYLLTYLLTRSFTPLLITYSFTPYSLTHLLTYGRTYFLTYLLATVLTYPITH